MKISLERVNEAVHFAASSSSTDVKVHIDGPPDSGGEREGVRPMELVLMALGSCSALDLITILQKQRQVIDDFRADVTGQRVDAVPAVFHSIHLVFFLKGKIEVEKAQKAAELAVKKYCSVHDMLAAGGINITYEVKINV